LRIQVILVADDVGEGVVPQLLHGDEALPRCVGKLVA
jgi:adenosyl cobinamide kinase/adenosyl cobinamide phosphate guanylyltransferase